MALFDVSFGTVEKMCADAFYHSGEAQDAGDCD